MPRHSTPTIGVLALQGAVEPHLAHLRAAGQSLDLRAVRGAADLEGLSGLILPGGESTTLLHLLAERKLQAPLCRACSALPVWGVCAGAILLARRVLPVQPSLASCDITIERNAYGRQLDSFAAEVADYPVAFIRAPRVATVGPGVMVRARHAEDAVWVEEGPIWATTFHPELTARRPSPFHSEFVERCAASARRGGAVRH